MGMRVFQLCGLLSSILPNYGLSEFNSQRGPRELIEKRRPQKQIENHVRLIIHTQSCKSENRKKG